MKRILVADDDEDIVGLVEIILKSGGYTVQSTQNAQDIESLVKSYEPDLLLMDVYMPPYDTRSICKNLKKDDSFHTPVLLFSANMINPESLQDCHADGFLAKPFEITQLLHFVREGLVEK